MNRKTKKKYKQEIRSLRNELYSLTLREHMSNMFRIYSQPFKVNASVPMYRCLYPEYAYPELRKLIMEELEKHIDEFIEIYRDDITQNYIASFKFIPCYRKDK